MSVRVHVALLLLACWATPLWAQSKTLSPLPEVARKLADAVVQAAVAPAQGKIVEADLHAGEVYVSVPEGARVLVGQQLRVVDRLTPLMEEGEVLGYREETIGQLEVTRIQGDRLLRTKILRKAWRRDFKPGTVVMLESVPLPLGVVTLVDPAGRSVLLGRDMADMLEVQLRNSGKVQVAERYRCDAVLTRCRVPAAELREPPRATRVRRYMPAGALLAGTVSLCGSTLYFDLRVIDLATGRPTAGVQANCECPEALLGRYYQQISL